MVKCVMIFAVLVLLSCVVWSQQREGHYSLISGILNLAGGNASQSSGFERVTGSLGGAYQTGQLTSPMFSAASGFFVVEPNRHPAISGDFDGNLKVDFSDFLIFAQGYARSEGDEGYVVQLDLDGDGMVGFSDFVAFARLYGT